MSDKTENPPVNRYLHDKAMDHIDHALGRPLWPLRETYRNHYAIDSDSETAAEFDASPNWHLTSVSGRMSFFSVTPAGRAALADHLHETSKVCGWYVQFGGYSRLVPAESASKARYSYYLDVSDSWSELRFGDFVRATNVRRAT